MVSSEQTNGPKVVYLAPDDAIEGEPLVHGITNDEKKEGLSVSHDGGVNVKSDGG